MDSKDRYIRVARYITGECSEEEKAAFERELDKNPDLKKEVSELREIWNAKRTQDNTWNVDEAWKRFDKEAGRIEGHKPEKPAIRKMELKRSKHRKDRLNWVMRIAAVIALIAMSSLFILMQMEDGTADNELTMNEVTTERGQRIELRLHDGSKILLNSESRIVYPKVFDEDSRTVQLTGEAYFDIEGDERPFYVHTEDLTIEILGTEFNVRAYGEEQSEVVVTKGKVGVSVSSSAEQDQAILTHGNMARHNQNENKLTVYRDVDVASLIGWIDYRLTFDGQPMRSISRQLERWYGVEIAFDDEEIKNMTVTASFEDESIHEVLRVITLALDLNYEITGRQITLFRNQR